MADRDSSNGRFVTGNQAAKGSSGGPGRPPKKREERYYEILVSTCTYKDWQAIIDMAVTQAKEGDPVARKWLSDNLVGPPAQRHEHTGAGGADLIPADKIVDALLHIRKSDEPSATTD